MNTQETARFPRRPVARATAALCLAWAGLGGWAGGAQAQATAAPDGTAQRVEVVGVTPVPGAGQAADTVPAHVQTARAADLARSQALHLGDFMNQRLAGVHLNEVQGNGFQPDVNYRGFSASPLLGNAQGLSVYLDGVRLNQPFGEVVSWDLVPHLAIDRLTLMPGSNPLFGLNTLGGALSVQTKDGRRHPGTALTLTLGSHARAALGVETGGQRADGLHWYLAAQHQQDDGWRVNSASRVGQVLGKLGQRFGETDLALTLAVAESDLNGNGLQEQRLLAADWRSVYTQPDNTRNRALLLNLAATHTLNRQWTLSGNLYARQLRTNTYNGDINEDALDQAVYQPNAAERAALAAAVFSGFPTAGETAANTPFPKWRCIANALLNDEPGEKCNGLIGTSRSRQKQWGASLQATSDAPLFGLRNQLVLGAAFEASRTHFVQATELGYLNADRTVTGVGAFGDGVTGGNVDGEPYDTRVDLSSRTRTWSVFASDTLALNPRTHLTLAARYNRSTVTNRDAITPGGGTGSLDGDHAFSRVNPALGLSFAATPALTVYGGASQGSRAPSAIELGCADPESPCKLPNAMAGDPPLKQVVTTTVEAGLRGRLGAADQATQWQLGIFRADNRDDILFVADNVAGYGYFKNFGKTRRQGLEASVNTRVGPLRLAASATWLDASFRSTEVVNGQGNSSNNEAVDEGLPGVEGTVTVAPGHRIPLVPRRLFKLSADWAATGAVDVGLDLRAQGGAYARGNENNAHQPDGVYYLGSGRSGGFAVLDLRGEWRLEGLAKGLSVSAKVANLLDRRYSTAAQLGVTGFNAQGQFVARPFPANAEGDRPLLGSTFYAPGAPRTWSVTLRYAFGG